MVRRGTCLNAFAECSSFGFRDSVGCSFDDDRGHEREVDLDVSDANAHEDCEMSLVEVNNSCCRVRMVPPGTIYMGVEELKYLLPQRTTVALF